MLIIRWKSRFVCNNYSFIMNNKNFVKIRFPDENTINNMPCGILLYQLMNLERTISILCGNIKGKSSFLTILLTIENSAVASPTQFDFSLMGWIRQPKTVGPIEMWRVHAGLSQPIYYNSLSLVIFI